MNIPPGRRLLSKDKAIVDCLVAGRNPWAHRGLGDQSVLRITKIRSPTTHAGHRPARHHGTAENKARSAASAPAKANTDHSSNHLPVPPMNQKPGSPARNLIGPEPNIPTGPLSAGRSIAFTGLAVAAFIGPVVRNAAHADGLVTQFTAGTYLVVIPAPLRYITNGAWRWSYRYGGNGGQSSRSIAGPDQEPK